MEITYIGHSGYMIEWDTIGLKELLNAAKIRYLFPMHFWDKPEIIQQLKTERDTDLKDTIMMDIEIDGQQWELGMEATWKL